MKLNLKTLCSQFVAGLCFSFLLALGWLPSCGYAQNADDGFNVPLLVPP